MSAVSFLIFFLASTLLPFGSVVHGLAQPTCILTRRAAIFVGGTVTAAAGTTGVALTTTHPLLALAYERRDVGDETRSAEQAAYNRQAYETNNRLERQGLKLETQAEQQASLTAALADYAYAPSTTTRNSSTGERAPSRQASLTRTSGK